VLFSTYGNAPEKGYVHLAILLQRLGFPLPNKPKRMQNVVEKIASKIEKTEQMERSCL
jgi:hypothetical protein